MLGGHRSTVCALGGFVAALLAASVVLGQDAVEPEQGPADNQSADQEPEAKPAQEAPQEQQSASPPQADISDRSPEREGEQEERPDSQEPFFQWQTFFKWQDTIAQWAMAFFGVVATLISIVAVYLLKGTLNASRDAVEVGEMANQEHRIIGEAQVRAYVSLHTAFLGPEETGRYLQIVADFENSGNSPARRLEVSYRPGVRMFPDGAFRWQEDFWPKPTRLHGVEIPAGDKRTIRRILTEFPLTDEEFSWVRDGRSFHAQIEVRFVYDDVFAYPFDWTEKWATVLTAHRQSPLYPVREWDDKIMEMIAVRISKRANETRH